MQPELMQNLVRITAGAGIGLSVVGGGIGLGLVFASAIQSIARQPEMSKDLMGLMWIALAFIESMALMGIVFCLFVLKS